MLYRKVPKSGESLSILGFGCMRFPQMNGKIVEEKALNLIETAMEHGINYFDTAFVYHNGENEKFLGKSIIPKYRNSIKVATKLPPWHVNIHDDMEKLFNSQLKKLRTDYVNYYLVHGIDCKATWERMKSLGLLDFLNKLKKNGYILNAGFSYHGDLLTFKEIVDEYDWDMCQIQYNYLDENNQAGTEGLEYAAGKNLGVVIMEPLRGGNLVKNIPYEVQDLLKDSQINKTPAELALRWIWNHPEVTVVLSGMNGESQILENSCIADNAYANSMCVKDLFAVNTIKSIYKKLMKVECTGCKYCMPCPSGVNIPLCFELLNKKYMFNDSRVILEYYNSLFNLSTNERSSPSLCKQCGICEKKCPQKIPIRKMLKKTFKEFESLRVKLLFNLKRH